MHVLMKTCVVDPIRLIDPNHDDYEKDKKGRNLNLREQIPIDYPCALKPETKKNQTANYKIEKNQHFNNASLSGTVENTRASIILSLDKKPILHHTQTKT